MKQGTYVAIPLILDLQGRSHHLVAIALTQALERRRFDLRNRDLRVP